MKYAAIAARKPAEFSQLNKKRAKMGLTGNNHHHDGRDNGRGLGAREQIQQNDDRAAKNRIKARSAAHGQFLVSDSAYPAAHDRINTHSVQWNSCLNASPQYSNLQGRGRSE